MKQVLLFPMNVPIIESNISTAIAVDTRYDNLTLQQASDRGRLRCYGCLGKMHVVRSRAVDGPVNHFAHSVDADQDCVFRVKWHYPDDETPPSSYNRNEDPGKMIERLLLRTLQCNLGDRPNTSIRSIPQRLPMIEIDGLVQPVEILSLARGDAKLWADPFSGRREHRETLFFVAGWDINSSALETVFPNLMSSRPCVVIWPPRPEQLEALFALTSTQSKGNYCLHPIEEIDVGWVDYRSLLGIDLDGDIIFIRKPYRTALEHLEKIIEDHQERSSFRTFFRLLAKILLVDGAKIHKSVFDESYEDARKPYKACTIFPKNDQLLTIGDFTVLTEKVQEVFAVCKDDILLDTAKEFYFGFLKNLENESEKVKEDTNSLLQELLESESKAEKIKEEFEKRVEELESELKIKSEEASSLRQELLSSELKASKIEQKLGTRINELEGEIKKHLLKLEEKEAENTRNLSYQENCVRRLESKLEDQLRKNRVLTNDNKRFHSLMKAIGDHWWGRRILKRFELEKYNRISH